MLKKKQAILLQWAWSWSRAQSTTRAWQFNWAGSEAAGCNSGQAKWRPNWFLFLPACISMRPHIIWVCNSIIPYPYNPAEGLPRTDGNINNNFRVDGKPQNYVQTCDMS